ncbi:hypothetical protein KTE91_27785 [Burkholderia multivorans]|uniref:hypothetical protein n=1 Tax=Burkholderia multivorans TaxID=87883 RepID=UPI001C21221E|nr:hypothetical protein [Burkholderia multivorans]MBU9438887.1 hypothetical protein [Burkholderia multivorans]
MRRSDTAADNEIALHAARRPYRFRPPYIVFPQLRDTARQQFQTAVSSSPGVAPRSSCAISTDRHARDTGRLIFDEPTRMTSYSRLHSPFDNAAQPRADLARIETLEAHVADLAAKVSRLNLLVGVLFEQHHDPASLSVTLVETIDRLAGGMTVRELIARLRERVSKNDMSAFDAHVELMRFKALKILVDEIDRQVQQASTETNGQ